MRQSCSIAFGMVGRLGEDPLDVEIRERLLGARQNACVLAHVLTDPDRGDEVRVLAALVLAGLPGYDLQVLAEHFDTGDLDAHAPVLLTETERTLLDLP